jgi:hypothetical protein
LELRKKLVRVSSKEASDLLGDKDGLLELLGVGVDADCLDCHREGVAVPIEDVASLRDELSLGLSLFGSLFGQILRLNYLHLIETHSHAQPGKCETHSKKAQPEVSRGETPARAAGGHVSPGAGR